MYNRAHTFLLPWILCERVRHLRGSSRWRLTAELSWSESMRPCDGENRGIKHYHQKRLQRSLLRPHSFLQSSWWFVCLLVVSVWMVPLFESMHFSAPIICWRMRWAGDKKKRKKKKLRTERWGYHLFFHPIKSVFRLSMPLHIRICLNVGEINQARITFKNSTSYCCFAIRNRGIQRHISPNNSTVVCTCRNWHT